jgi:hypothetical protein
MRLEPQSKLPIKIRDKKAEAREAQHHHMHPTPTPQLHPRKLHHDRYHESTLQVFVGI